ncbi:FAD-binding oxidoreductase [Williamsia deligens]|uniref:nitric oxide dioxygenase n=1 Tax=Williamsia deligens TaxID=321325 RepID=A0ABW3G5Y1_9NOCA|nr:FAD-binding oxidoreductase [Williamsia deligens]MCP2194215.1 NAD(P)H-flavin reductase [Williamsia deligens]
MGSHARHGLLTVRDAVRADPDRFAHDFYTRLFAADPDLRDLFPLSMAHQREALVGVLDHVLTSLPDTATHTQLIDTLSQLGRDHRKFGVTGAHYDVFCRTLVDHLAATTGPDLDDDIAAVTTQSMSLVTGVMRGAAQTAPGPATWQARVVKKHRLTRDLAVVRLVADDREHFLDAFAAGQYVEVSVPQWPRVWRHLSPALPPNPNGHLEFHVRSVPGGSVSASIVGETAVGDVWTLAQGHGTLAPMPGRETLMVAGGTGIAPLRALLVQMAQRADTCPTHLFWGTRYPGELYDALSLTGLAGVNPWLSVTVVSETETDPWWLTSTVDLSVPGVDHRIGRVADVVVDSGDWSGRQVLVAGSSSMIEATRRALVVAGVPDRDIDHDPV